MIRTLAFAPLFLLAAVPLSAQQPGPFAIVESGESYARLADAVAAIGGGAGTIRIAPGRYADCAVQEAGRISYRAAAPGTAIFAGGMCEGKAVLVLRGRSARVEGLVFSDMAVADGNGAGIRLEEGDLVVTESLFTDGQSGILTAGDPTGSIAIERSTFRRLGKHPDGNGAHSVYVGRYGSLRVANVRFEQGTGGHYLKSRAPRIEVVDSSFDDSRGRATNYHIDLSNGAVGRIAGNAFVQGTGKENYGTIIAVAPEGEENRSAGLVIENNQAALAPGFRWSTAFVGNWSNAHLILRDNRLAKGIEERVAH